MNYRTTLDNLRHARCHLGHGVIYRPSPGKKEYGIVRDVNEHWVFVLYQNGRTAKATDPSQLELMTPCEHTEL